jgi:choline dehydrogenase
MRWDYYVNHFSSLEDQRKDSKMTWRTSTGAKYVGHGPRSETDEPLGILYPRSGTLGGCAAHNAMITVYPHESDWTNLVSLTGDKSWNARNMRKYFERLERCRYLPSDVTGHGYFGWFETSVTDLTLVVEDPKLLSVILATATSLGKGVIGKLLATVTGLGDLLLRDLNNAQPTRDTSDKDLYQVPLAVVSKQSVRSTPRSFLLGVANAVNRDGSRKYKLDIQLHTLVTKVRFDTTGDIPRATGVDFLRGQSLYRADPRAGQAATEGEPGSVNALKEVIVAGGTFNSPQLLMLSGIGPRDALDEVGIPVLVDSPVGGNLQDHYETATVSRTDAPFSLLEPCTFTQTPDDRCLARWQRSPILKGPYGTNGVPIALLKRSSVNSPGAPTDTIITGGPVNFRGYFPGYSNDSLEEPNYWTWIIETVHPRNRAGTVRLRSADPRDTPIVNFNYYDTGDRENGAAERDMQAMYDGMSFARQILRDNYIPLDGAPFREVWPGPNVTSEKDVKAFLRKEAWGHHASCTCPIGPDDDPNAVLDSKMRVRGVTGLRVVDASVFPLIPGTYTALSTYMVSEKAADDILAEV